MMNLTTLFKRMALGLVLASVPMLGGCADSTLTWTEEVKLLDGRVITVTQKRRVDNDNIEREAWLTFKLPEFGDKEIVWHENLNTMVLNVYQGKLYLVGFPGTEREFRQYGRPMPMYIGYRYDGGQWMRIAFNEIPEAIYGSNLYIQNVAFTTLEYVSLADKETLMKDETLPNEIKRIDPNTKLH